MTSYNGVRSPRRRLQRGLRRLGLLAGLSLIGLPACQGADARPNTAAASSVAATSAGECEAPLRIAAVPDKSASADSNQTPELRIEDLAPVIEHVVKCGGELSISTLDSDSKRPFVRLYVSEPGSPPAEPVRHGTARQVARAVRRYQADTARHNAEERRRVVEAQRAAEAFRAEAGPLLSRPRDASRSAAITAINRIGYLLDEPGTWRTPPRRVALVVSDLENNVPGIMRPLPVGTEFYLVNTDTLPDEIKSLRPPPVQFESPAAAIRLLLSRK